MKLCVVDCFYYGKWKIVHQYFNIFIYCMCVCIIGDAMVIVDARFIAV